MSRQSLLKGFEVEVFTGRSNGEHVGVAGEVSRDLSDFVREPDQRNLEYITLPNSNYNHLVEALLAPRRRLRQWLLSRGLTLLPGSTLSLGNSEYFERSDLQNTYHDFIENNYGTRVVTASVHINLGLTDLPLLFAALRLIRCEAALFLALSASSPFLDGRLTGVHSQRWLQFPLTPEKVPLFLDHSHYVGWVEEHLANGTMLNERHLWTSVRPNGPNRPYDLNRIELRICDLITDPDLLLAVTVLLELRVVGLLRDPESVDPFSLSELNKEELAELSDRNDTMAAKHSFHATLNHWQDGREIKCWSWIQELLAEVTPLAREMNLLEHLAPLHLALEKGNQSMQWLDAIEAGGTVEAVIKEGILAMEGQETLNVKTEVF